MQAYNKQGIPHSPRKWVEPKDIPHVHIGSVEGWTGAQVYVLFPKLWKSGQKFTELSIQHKRLQIF